MYDRGLSVLQQYGLEAESSYRGRGALICQTGSGLRLIREYRGSEMRLAGQFALLEEVVRQGFPFVDRLCRNGEEKLVSVDADNIPYSVKVWFDGRECDTHCESDVLRCVRALAGLHKAMHQLPVKQQYTQEPLLGRYIRRNQELKKVRTYMRGRTRKSAFENSYLQVVDDFLQKGEQALLKLKNTDYDGLRQTALQRGELCHGECNQHNFLLTAGEVAVVNFDHWNYDTQMEDLYQFMRKILEKNNWDIALARRMEEAYQAVKPLREGERENLRIRFAYPEKFWKLANHYHNGNKAWASEKDAVKLKKIVEQKRKWEAFLEG